MHPIKSYLRCRYQENPCQKQIRSSLNGISLLLLFQSSSIFPSFHRVLSSVSICSFNRQSMTRAPFIVFEGTDRSGKTTQTQRYVSHLQKIGVSVSKGMPWRFPDRTTEVGKMIDAYLKGETDLDDRMLHLLFSANRWEKAELIKEKLSAGETVVVDRYAYSGVAYSVAKGLPIDWCRASDTGLPAPDVVIYLDLSPIAARGRGNYGNERYEKLEMQKAVSETFVKLRTEKWRVVDADADEDTVFLRVCSAIEQALHKVDLPDILESLW